MNLNFGRTSATHSRCTFANCRTPNDHLRSVSRAVRFKALKSKQIYIPPGARACAYHLQESHCNYDNNGLLANFTKEHIEDMLKLLCEAKDDLMTGN